MMFIKDQWTKLRLYLLTYITIGAKKQHYKDKYNIFIANQKILKNINKLRKKIKNKIKKGKKIIVYFAAYEKAQWTMSSIYEAMKNDNLFEPKILTLEAFERKSTEKNATNDLIKFFKDKNYDIVIKIDENNIPDILFTARLDLNNIGLKLDLQTIYKKILCCYFPYYWVMEEERVDSYYFSSNNTKYLWKEYVSDIRAFKAALSNPMKGKNVVLSGHPKTDEITNASDKSPYWKQKDSKKIIYAPHWSLYNHEQAKGCFLIYYKEMYNYLKEHPEIEIIIKPHPFLKEFIANKDLQKTWHADLKITIDEYNKFLEKWKNLPNGNIMDDGDYFDLFKSSDAMILDSLSFIAEYGFLCKPMCYLSRAASINALKKGFNSMGKELIDTMDIAYKWQDIVNFIENTVIIGNNNQKVKREQIAKKYLITNAGHVGEFIKNDIKRSLLKF